MAKQIITKSDIPDVTKLKAMVMTSIKSGRQKSLKSVRNELASAVGLSRKQGALQLGSAPESLFLSRMNDAIAALINDGLIESPKEGYLKLTVQGKALLASNGNAPSSSQPKPRSSGGKRFKKSAAFQQDDSHTAQRDSESSDVNPHAAMHARHFASKAHDANQSTPSSSLAESSDVQSAPSQEPNTPISDIAGSTEETAQFGDAVGMQKTIKENPLGAVPCASSPADWAPPSNNPLHSNLRSNLTALLPFILGIISIVLCLLPIRILGVILGSAAFTMWLLGRSKPVLPQRLNRATAICSVTGVLACSVLLQAGASQPPAASPDATQIVQEEQLAADEPAEPEPTLGILVSAESWTGDGQNVSVAISGTTEDGETVNEAKSINPNEPRELNLAAGTYTFAIAPINLNDGETIYRESNISYPFDGEQQVMLVIPLELDDAAMQQAQEQKAAEEAAAQAQTQAEQEAQAQATQEAQARSEASQSGTEAAGQAEAANPAPATPEPAATQPVSETVYITNTGEKYHRDGCSYLRKSKIPISLSDAEARGYTPCSRCF